MRVAVLVVALGWFAALAPGAAEGRQGNALFETQDTAGAEQRYIAGLAQEDSPAAIAAALWNNLGLARLMQDRPAEADSAFMRALPLLSDAERRGLTAYNRGTAALSANEVAGAVENLRRAVVLMPAYVPAQVNLEIALRRQRDGEEQEQPEPPEPSPFAQRLKVQADSLVEARQYSDAYGLMEDGLARDSTVAAFGEFIQRLGQIVEVDTDPPPQP